jgi:Na+/H+ antiporter NhaC
LVKDGLLTSLTDGWNMGIIIFLVILGMIVVLMARSGGEIDDYFSALTAYSTMRPVTDKAYVSRAKLAYLIDGTAAPVCILAPIGAWAAAVASYIPEENSDINGFTMFVKAIPFNFYAILTIVMILAIVILKFDYGPMAKHEYNAEKHHDLFTGERKTICKC